MAVIGEVGRHLHASTSWSLSEVYIHKVPRTYIEAPLEFGKDFGEWRKKEVRLRVLPLRWLSSSWLTATNVDDGLVKAGWLGWALIGDCILHCLGADLELLQRIVGWRCLQILRRSSCPWEELSCVEWVPAVLGRLSEHERGSNHFGQPAAVDVHMHCAVSIGRKRYERGMSGEEDACSAGPGWMELDRSETRVWALGAALQ
jgi:hypothetical protein